MFVWLRLPELARWELQSRRRGGEVNLLGTGGNPCCDKARPVSVGYGGFLRLAIPAEATIGSQGLALPLPPFSKA